MSSQVLGVHHTCDAVSGGLLPPKGQCLPTASAPSVVVKVRFPQRFFIPEYKTRVDLLCNHSVLFFDDTAVWC